MKNSKEKVYCDAIENIGIERLSELLKLVDDVKESGCTGEIIISVEKGDICQIEKKILVCELK